MYINLIYVGNSKPSYLYLFVQTVVHPSLLLSYLDKKKPKEMLRKNESK